MDIVIVIARGRHLAYGAAHCAYRHMPRERPAGRPGAPFMEFRMVSDEELLAVIPRLRGTTPESAQPGRSGFRRRRPALEPPTGSSLL